MRRRDHRGRGSAPRPGSRPAPAARASAGSCPATAGR